MRATPRYVKSKVFRQRGCELPRRDYLFLMKFVRKHNIRFVLEFGPGLSTYAFLENGCDVTTLEYKPTWLKRSKKRFSRFSNVAVFRFKNVRDISVEDVDSMRFDLAFVDSPRGSSFKPVRWNTARYAAIRTNLLILHDLNKKGIGRTVEMLKSDFGFRRVKRMGKIGVFSKTDGLRLGEE